jgi:hypothetical protein
MTLNGWAGFSRSYRAGPALRTGNFSVDSWMKVGMQDNKQPSVKSLGFVTVRHHAVHGFFGGYLIVNELARPLEFHCTLPVQPTRAQQILYGATLHEFVCGEQIARALVTKAKCVPEVLFADTLSVLTLRHMHSIPVGVIDMSQSPETPLARPTNHREQLHRFKLHGHNIAMLPEYSGDASVFESLFGARKLSLDLLEPFGRIEEALLEAHPATKAA